MLGLSPATSLRLRAISPGDVHSDVPADPAPTGRPADPEPTRQPDPEERRPRERKASVLNSRPWPPPKTASPKSPLEEIPRESSATALRKFLQPPTPAAPAPTVVTVPTAVSPPTLESSPASSGEPATLESSPASIAEPAWLTEAAALQAQEAAMIAAAAPVAGEDETTTAAAEGVGAAAPATLAAPAPATPVPVYKSSPVTPEPKVSEVQGAAKAQGPFEAPPASAAPPTVAATAAAPASDAYAYGSASCAVVERIGSPPRELRASELAQLHAQLQRFHSAASLPASPALPSSPSRSVGSAASAVIDFPSLGTPSAPTSPHRRDSAGPPAAGAERAAPHCLDGAAADGRVTRAASVSRQVIYAIALSGAVLVLIWYPIVRNGLQQSGLASGLSRVGRSARKLLPGAVGASALVGSRVQAAM
jgi:hypothetical protein